MASNNWTNTGGWNLPAAPRLPAPPPNYAQWLASLPAPPTNLPAPPTSFPAPPTLPMPPSAAAYSSWLAQLQPPPTNLPRPPWVPQTTVAPYPLNPHFPVNAPFSLNNAFPVNAPPTAAGRAPMTAPFPLNPNFPVDAPYPMSKGFPTTAPYPLNPNFPVNAPPPGYTPHPNFPVQVPPPAPRPYTPHPNFPVQVPPPSTPSGATPSFPTTDIMPEGGVQWDQPNYYSTRPNMGPDPWAPGGTGGGRAGGPTTPKPPPYNPGANGGPDWAFYTDPANTAGSVGDDALHAAGSVADDGLGGAAARAGSSGALNYAGNYLKAGLTTLNPLSYRGGNVPFVNPAAGTASSFANLASKIPGSGKISSGLKYGVGSGLAASMALNYAGSKLQGTDTQSPWDNIVESAAGGGNIGLFGGPLPGAIGVGIGAGAQGLTEGVRALLKAQGKELTGREGSFFDILANSDTPVLSPVANYFGGDENTGLRWDAGGDQSQPQISTAAQLNTAFDTLNLDPVSRADLTNTYQTTLGMLKVQQQINPEAFAASYKEMTGQDYTGDDTALEQLALSEIVNTYLPNAVEQQGARQAAMNRAAQYQSQIGPYFQPIADNYAHLAELSGDPRIAALLNAESLASERQLRSLPQLEAMTAYQSQLNQLAQQQFQAAINGTGGGASSDPFAAIDQSLLAAAGG